MLNSYFHLRWLPATRISVTFFLLLLPLVVLLLLLSCIYLCNYSLGFYSACKRYTIIRFIQNTDNGSNHRREVQARSKDRKRILRWNLSRYVFFFDQIDSQTVFIVITCSDFDSISFCSYSYWYVRDRCRQDRTFRSTFFFYSFF